MRFLCVNSLYAFFVRDRVANCCHCFSAGLIAILALFPSDMAYVSILHSDRRKR